MAVEADHNIVDVIEELKKLSSLQEAYMHSLPLPENIGYLIPLCQLHRLDSRLIQQFADWREKCSFAYPSRFPVTFDGTKRWVEALLNNPYRMLFVITDPFGLPIGHIGFYYHAETCEAEIENVVRGVDSVYPGLMHAVMLHLTSWLQHTANPHRVFLRVLTSNAHAVEFYQKLGFTTESTEPLRSHTDGAATVLRPLEPDDTGAPDDAFNLMVYRLDHER